MERFSLDRRAASCVDAYAEYRQIVGNDDGGVLFTEQEYEAYKAQRGIKVDHPPQSLPPPRPTEDEVMAIYEERYQARRKAERARGTGNRRNFAVALNAPPMHVLDMLNGVPPETSLFKPAFLYQASALPGCFFAISPTCL
eukprot:m.360769 g.360769  ORF g.360769 m.360769 type:complete len:141 (-) comp20771_c0_seq12:846-1268(-)